MPWLAATALLHSAVVVEKRDTLKSWTVLLAILAFSLSLLGTFLVRSGVLTSVHAFATDPTRGVFILGLLVVAIGGSLLLYAWRAPLMQGGGVFAPVSREGGLVLNNLLLATATATVLLGTLYPLALDVLGGPKISVGAPFFNATFLPLMVPVLLFLPVGSALAWKRGDLPGVLGRLTAAFAATALAVLVYLALSDARSALAAVGLGLGVWAIAGSLNELALRTGLLQAGPPGPGPRPRPAALGLGDGPGARGRRRPRSSASPSRPPAGPSGSWSCGAGDMADLAGYQVTFQGVAEMPGPNYVARRGTFEVTRGGAPVAEVASEKRFFPVERNATTEAGIHTTPCATSTSSSATRPARPGPGRCASTTTRS
jgi:cytochrome c-type biogenesis protein CcmF